MAPREPAYKIELLCSWRRIITITLRLKRYLFIFIAVYLVLFAGTYYYQIFAVRVFQHLFLTALLSLWLILRIAKGQGLPRTPLNTLLYINIIVWFISAFLSLDPRMALENLWFPLTDLLLFFVMVDLVQTGRERLLIDTQFLLAVLVIVLSGLQLGSWLFGWGFGTPTIGWASVLGGDLLLPLTSPRLFIPLGVTTWLAAYTAPLAVVAGGWGLAARRHSTRNAFWLLGILLALIMLLTSSRGGWFSLAAGAGVLLGLHSFGDLNFRKYIYRFRAPLVLLAAATFVIVVFVVIHLGADSRHLAGDVLRLDLWRSAAAITADHPFLGVGPGLFGRAYRLYRDPINVDNRLGTAHNFYLNTLTETGVIGGLVALGLGVVLLRTCWKLWRRAETRDRKIHLEAMFAGLVGFGVQSFFDMFTAVPLVLLALLMTAYCVTEVSPRFEPPPKGSIPAALASLIVTLAFGVGLVRSDQAQAAFIASVNGLPQQAQQAVTLDPALHLYDLQNAYLTGKTGNLTQAVVAYQQALTLEPTWDTGWINLAALLERQGNITAALDALRKAINIDDHDGALLLWARLTEGTDSASTEMIRDTYLRYLLTLDQGKLPLSMFWSQTDVRKQALALYLQKVELDTRYRVMAAQNAEDLASLVPTTPITAADWWVVGEYALSHEGNSVKAEQAFTKAIALNTENTLGDYYVARARARVAIDRQGAVRDLNIAELLGTYNESPNAVRALLVSSIDEQHRLLAIAVPPQIIDQNFEGVLFGGRVAAFDLLPEMRLPGPGHSALQPWYDLAVSYATAGQIDQAADVYRAILNRSPDELEARTKLDRLTGSDS